MTQLEMTREVRLKNWAEEVADMYVSQLDERGVSKKPRPENIAAASLYAVSRDIVQSSEVLAAMKRLGYSSGIGMYSVYKSFKGSGLLRSLQYSLS